MLNDKSRYVNENEKFLPKILPDSERPYEVPGNWVWVKLGECFDVTSSKRVFKDDWKDTGIRNQINNFSSVLP